MVKSLPCFSTFALRGGQRKGGEEVEVKRSKEKEKGGETLWKE